MDSEINQNSNFNCIDRALDNKNYTIEQLNRNNSQMIERANTFKGNSDSAPLPDFNENLKINDKNEKLSENRYYNEKSETDKKKELPNFNENNNNFQNNNEIRKEKYSKNLDETPISNRDSILNFNPKINKENTKTITTNVGMPENLDNNKNHNKILTTNFNLSNNQSLVTTNQLLRGDLLLDKINSSNEIHHNINNKIIKESANIPIKNPLEKNLKDSNNLNFNIDDPNNNKGKQIDIKIDDLKEEQLDKNKKSILKNKRILIAILVISVIVATIVISISILLKSNKLDPQTAPMASIQTTTYNKESGISKTNFITEEMSFLNNLSFYEFFSNFKIECGINSVLANFHFSKSKQGKYFFEYNCIKKNDWEIIGKYHIINNPTDIGANPRTDVHYLDRQLVKCKETHALISFKFYFDSVNKKIYYEYNCGEVKILFFNKNNNNTFNESDKNFTNINNSLDNSDKKFYCALNKTPVKNGAFNIDNLLEFQIGKSEFQYINGFQLKSKYSPAFYFSYDYYSCD